MTSAADLIPGIHRACSHWKNALNLQQQCKGLEDAFNAGRDSTIDKVKGIVESVCKTILTERGVEFGESEDLGEYISKTMNALELNQSRGTRQFQKIVSLHNKLATEINNYRNSSGVVAHGKDGYLDPLSQYHLRAALLAGDSIVSFLFESFRGLDPKLRHTREPHEKFEHLNKLIDGKAFVRAETDPDDGSLLVTISGPCIDDFEMRIPASRLLYDLDREAYIEVLSVIGTETAQQVDEAITNLAENILEDISGGQDEVPPDDSKPTEQNKEARDKPPVETPLKGTSRTIRRVTQYEGKYSDHLHALYEFLFHGVQLDDLLKAEDINDLSKTILSGFEQVESIDWQSHPSSLARVRTFLKKTGKLFGLDPERGKVFVEQVEEWLKTKFSLQKLTTRKFSD